MTDVERIQAELAAIISLARDAGGPSDQIAAESVAAKTLLLSAASYFERAVCEIIVSSARQGGTRSAYCNFIDKQALERRYHSMFDWRGKNLNQFFGLFGTDAKSRLSEALIADDMTEAAKSFIYIGSQRNLLVHENFAGYSLETTFDEVFDRYHQAFHLLEWLRAKLLEEAARDDSE